MELIGKNGWARRVIANHGREWSIVSHDTSTLLIESDKTFQEMRIWDNEDPNFHRITQKEFKNV